MVKTSPSKAGGAGSNPGQGAEIPHASRPNNQNIKQKHYCNKCNKDFKNGLHQKKKSLKKNGVMLCMCGGGQYMEKKSLYPPLNFCCKPKTALKNKTLKN